MYHDTISYGFGDGTVDTPSAMDSILKYIESNYPVEEISVNGAQCWPYLRWRLHYVHRVTEVVALGESRSASRIRLDTGLASPESMNEDGSSESDEEQPSVGGVVVQLRRARRKVKTGVRLMKVVLRGLPYGFRNWFRRYDYIVLTNESIRKKMGDKYMNTFLDPIIDELGRERVLCIESTPRFHRFETNQLYTEYVTSHVLLALLSVLLRFVRRMLRIRYKVENRWIIDRLEEEFGLVTQTDAHVELFEARRKVFHCLFRIMQPRALLLTFYYDDHKQPAIRAAKSLGIQVIEVQHGVVGTGHPAYNVYRDMDRSCFPDYLLVFGRQELATFSDSRFVDPANLRAVGSYYIDYVRANCATNAQVFDLVSSYQRVVGVTLQWLYGKRLPEFVCEAARQDRTILYILIPRQGQVEAYASMALPENVVVIRDKNFYELMAYCDFHSTVSSTCAIEAPALGVQNALIDIGGSARRYYEEVLSDSRITRFADTPRGYVDLVLSFPRLDRDVVRELHTGFFAENYRENIRNFVKAHLL